MRQILNVHIGQAGVQLGEQWWRLYCLEHGIGNDGAPLNSDDKGRDSLESFFNNTGNNRYVPRAVFVDTDPSVVDAMRKGPIGQLFNPAYLVTGKEDAASNYGRGCYTIGRELLEDTLDVLRRITEHLDSLQGFMISHSIGGGTGSGFGAALLQELQQLHSKKSRLQLMIVPSPDISSVVVEPYNALLHLHSTVESVDCSFLVDNQALYKLCQSQLQIKYPSYSNANAVLAQGLSSIVNSMSLDGSLNVDLNEFQTNLVPFQRLHFAMMAYSPFVAAKRCGMSLEPSIEEIMRELFEPPSRLLSCNLQQGGYIACCFLCRGDVAKRQMHDTLAKIRTLKKMNVVEWSPAAFKSGLNGHAPSALQDSGFLKVPRSACMLANHTAIGSVWENVTRKFRLMYAKKAFVHWYYNEGLELNEFDRAYENVVKIQEEYAELEKDLPHDGHNVSRTDGV